MRPPTGDRIAAVSAGLEVSVVVPSHGRELRLLWLLNALEEQTHPAAAFEVVVVHDYDRATAERILDAHPLSRAGRLRHVAVAPGSGSPPLQRNIGWRAARAPLVAFTDDDCRPDPAWLERLLAAADGRPDAFVQGTTRADPLEGGVLAAPHVRSLALDPPTYGAETCNVLYGRALLERLGGFDERAVAGEDMDAGFRAREAGARQLAAPDALVYHAVTEVTLAGYVRTGLKWRYLPLQAKLHPGVRRRMPLRVFWSRGHLRVTVAVVGLAAARRRPAAALLALHWLAFPYRHRGRRFGAVAHVAEIPGRTVRELAEIATFAWGSARYRTFVL
jgi:glycosyltransferase involved in cell wall biosynthesis